jgi:ABC-type multidrug transport system ATPase subunit
MHADNYGFPQSEMRAQIYKMMELVELSDSADDFVRNHFSGMRHYA